ncbi:MAG: hypothetical protein HUU21_28860 [Polyangiaceae bacterium]|nr:hypothetical protein [Polyangiaceae bacterium]
MPRRVHDYISAFEKGEDFQPPSTGLIVNGQPEAASLQTLAQALDSKPADVREQIVALLVDLGVRTDPLTPAGAEVLRHKEIIQILVEHALQPADLGREAAMDALRKLVRSEDLAPYGDRFTDALRAAPTQEAFLLVAKAKASSAAGLVDTLVHTPAWANVEAARIAYAALGDTATEDEFLAREQAASTGQELAIALGSLALIGTERSLKAIAQRLRSPLIITLPGAYDKSVRLNVLDALRYNYPDQPVLYPNNINDDSDYAAAEQFCSRKLGVVYTEARPPFLTYFGHPIPLQ